MDMFNLKIGSKMLKGIITKFIKKSIKKKYGIDVNLNMDDFILETIDGKVKIQTGVTAEVQMNDVYKLMENM